jgi:hypothetical protein
MGNSKSAAWPGGVAGRVAGFSAALLAKARAASVEMTKFLWVLGSKNKNNGKNKNNDKDEIQGSLHCGGKVRRLRSR